MRMNPGSAAALAVAGFLLFNGCAEIASSGVSSRWQDLSPKDTTTVFLADELDMELRFMRYRASLELNREFERGRWTGPGGRYPRLYLRLESLYPGYYFDKDITPIRNIIKRNKRFQDHGVEYGERGTVANKLGLANYETFQSGDLYCFLIRQGFGEAWSGDNKILSGYYCDTTPVGNFPDRVQLVLKRIGVKGEGIPDADTGASNTGSAGKTTGSNETSKTYAELSASEVLSLLWGNTEVGVLSRPSKRAVEGNSGQTYKAYYRDRTTVWYKLDGNDDVKRWVWEVRATGVLCRGPSFAQTWCRAITPDSAGGYEATGFRTGNLRYQFRIEKGLFGISEELLK